MQLKKTTTPEAKPFKGQFSLIPVGAEAHECEVCEMTLPVTKFPTTTGPDRRTAECRVCRDKRQGRAEKAEVKAKELAEAAEAKAASDAVRLANRKAGAAKAAATRKAKAAATAA